MYILYFVAYFLMTINQKVGGGGHLICCHRPPPQSEKWGDHVDPVPHPSTPVALLALLTWFSVLLSTVDEGTGDRMFSAIL